MSESEAAEAAPVVEARVGRTGAGACPDNAIIRVRADFRAVARGGGP